MPFSHDAKESGQSIDSGALRAESPDIDFGLLLSEPIRDKKSDFLFISSVAGASSSILPSVNAGVNIRHQAGMAISLSRRRKRRRLANACMSGFASSRTTVPDAQARA